MSGVRTLCALVGLLGSTLAHGEQVADMYPVFQAICLGSNGDPAQAEMRATSIGFKTESMQNNWKLYSTGKRDTPLVVIQYASPSTHGMNVCKTAGKSMFLALFLDEARARNMVKFPPEKVAGFSPEEQKGKFYVQRGCDPVALSPGCSTLSALGAPVEAGEYNGIFRLAIVPKPEV